MYKRLLFLVFLSFYAYGSQAPMAVLAVQRDTVAGLPQRHEGQPQPNADDATCIICTENFDNYHIRTLLSCDIRHILCHKCAIEIITRRGNNAKCPFCRSRFRLHDNCIRALQNPNQNNLANGTKKQLSHLLQLNENLQQGRLEDGRQNNVEQVNEDRVIAGRLEALERARVQERLRRLRREAILAATVQAAHQADADIRPAAHYPFRQIEREVIPQSPEIQTTKALKIVRLVVIGASLGFKLLEGIIRVTKRLFTKKETESTTPAEKVSQTAISSASSENQPLPAST